MVQNVALAMGELTTEFLAIPGGYVSFVSPLCGGRKRHDYVNKKRELSL